MVTSGAARVHTGTTPVIPPADVDAFIRRYGPPYEPGGDTYHRDPLVVHGRYSKTSALYNAHSYHTKVPPDAIKPYLEHYTRPGEIVLDPFCGSGMTGLACLLTGRHAVLSDLSPAAIHIAYNYCTPVAVGDLRRAWSRIEREVASEFRWLYGTTCDRCHGPATIQFMVWSDVFACPACLGDIVLWDAAVVRDRLGLEFDPPLSGLTPAAAGWRPALAGAVPPKHDGKPRQRGDVLERFPCPLCGDELKKPDCQYQRSEPVLTCYECDGPCRPKRHERAPTQAERHRIAEIAGLEPPYWVPDVPFEPTREMWRGIHRDQGISSVRDFWTARNLWALATLWARASVVEDERVCRALRFVLTSTFNRSSKTTRFLFGKGGNSSMNGTLYVGAFTCENNLLRLASRKWDDVYRGFLEQVLFQNSRACVVQSSAATLHDIPDDTVDYIFTDPPFGSNIFYSDCSLLWEAWLGHLTSESEEAVWNKSRKPGQGGKILDDYRLLMEQSFAEMYRVLKPGRWATVIFSNSDDRVWEAIQAAAQKAGFGAARSGSLDKVQRSFKGVRGAKRQENVLTKDVVMNLLKPVSRSSAHAASGIADPAEYVHELLAAYLANLSRQEGVDPHQRSTQALYDHAITTLLASGRSTAGIGLAFVQSVAQEHFKQADGLWYRRGDRVAGDRPQMDIVDERSAVVWLEQRLSAAPATEAELSADFHAATTGGAVIAGGLERLLRENFVCDPQTRLWRVPGALERDALNDTAAAQRRRQVQRVAQGAGDGMTPLELLELAEEALRREMYSEASRIADRIHAPDLGPAQRERFAAVRAVIGAFVDD